MTREQTMKLLEYKEYQQRLSVNHRIAVSISYHI